MGSPQISPEQTAGRASPGGLWHDEDIAQAPRPPFARPLRRPRCGGDPPPRALRGVRRRRPVRVFRLRTRSLAGGRGQCPLRPSDLVGFALRPSRPPHPARFQRRRPDGCGDVPRTVSPARGGRGATCDGSRVHRGSRCGGAAPGAHPVHSIRLATTGLSPDRDAPVTLPDARPTPVARAPPRASDGRPGRAAGKPESGESRWQYERFPAARGTALPHRRRHPHDRRHGDRGGSRHRGGRRRGGGRGDARAHSATGRSSGVLSAGRP